MVSALKLFLARLILYPFKINFVQVEGGPAITRIPREFSWSVVQVILFVVVVGDLCL